MQEGDEVEPVLDRVVVPNLLVAAVALIDRVVENPERKRKT
jgi:hypothetical protein